MPLFRKSAGCLAWRPHSTNPAYAAVRMRCLNPLRRLRRAGFPVELFKSENSSAYRVQIVQAMIAHPAYTDEDAWRSFVKGLTQAREAGQRVVVDDCDNHFFNPQGRPEIETLGQRLKILLALADHVVVSSRALAATYAPQCGVVGITVISDGVENGEDVESGSWLRNRVVPGRRQAQRALNSYRADAERERGAGVGRLVWFGSHGSSYANGGMGDLALVTGLLNRLASDLSFSLSVISNNRRKFEAWAASCQFPTHYLEWDRVTFSEALPLHDIAVFPIAPSEFTVCKSANRVASALQSGLAVIADEIPSYRDFAGAIRLGEWEGALGHYLTNADARRRDVSAGRRIVAEYFSPDRIASQWRAMMEGQLAEGRR